MMRTPMFILFAGLLGWTVPVAVAQDAVAEPVAVEAADEEAELPVRVVGGFGAESGEGWTTERVGRRVPKRWKWHGGHWMGIGVYYNGLVQSLGRLRLPEGAGYLRQTPASIGVNINFVDLSLVSDRHFGLITGLGLAVNNFRFEDNMTLTRNEAGYIVPDYRFDAAGIELEKSKLTTVYLQVPLLAEFQFGRSGTTSRSPGFVNFGLVGGVRLQGHTKVKYREQGENGGRYTLKQYSGLNLRNFRYGVECNVGYRWVALSARYYPQSLFVKDRGPEVQQVDIGLSLLF